MRRNVYFVVILIISVCSLASTEDKNISGCIIPSKPPHGNYITDLSDDTASPGDVVTTLKVVYICEPGYELVGPYRASCDAGVWSETPHVPECIPHCSIENKTNIVTCAADERRCSIPDTFTKPISTRIGLGGEYCGVVSTRMPVIAGGAPAHIRVLPWHAAVYKKTSTPYMQICGGTIVKDRVVISAAHCFWSDLKKLLPASDYAVAVGKRYRPWADTHDKSQHSDIRDIKVPPRYYGGATNFQDDVALLVLTTPVEYNEHVRPVCLDFDHELETSQLQDGNLGKVGGWGLTAEDGPPSPVLRAVQVPYVPVGRCLAESPPYFLPSITSDKICAGYKNGTAVCKGDSGGGLVFPTSNRYYLRGVVSTAPSSGHLCNVHAWATFTLISKHERFIKDILKEVSLIDE